MDPEVFNITTNHTPNVTAEAIARPVNETETENRELVELNHVRVQDRSIRVHDVSNSTAVLEAPDHADESFPDGGLRSWLVVFGSFFLLMGSYGLMNTVGVMQSYIEAHQLSTYSTTAVGWIFSVFIFVTLLLGVFVGPLFDSHGPKLLVYAGSAITVLSLFLFAECTKYWQFFLCFGILGGIGAALVSTVAMSCVPHWFHVRAGMAMGTALAGSGLGGVVFPFMLRAGFSNLGFKWTIRILAIVVGACCGLGSFMVRTRLPKTFSKAVINLKCFKDMRFTWLSAGAWCLELEFFSLMGIYPTFIIAQGFSADTSIYLLVILNVSSLFGRLIAGRLGDRYGRLNTLMTIIVVGILCIFSILYPFSHSLPALYTFSCLYGLASGSFISLAPVCIRQVSDVKEIGLRFGTCYSLVSFATLISIPIAGEILGKVGSKALVLWIGAVLVWTLGLFIMARWTCQEYRWKWLMKV
ncbi:monocarboxylate transporter [Talaromyces proteolyticus]|uniref:Monocarboxylate transporter n=1 Tax=Talaromyces proteolyticus TaxID=1131652 RepID=A0AAD4KP02_9EURO|nr:monocarboxylate transporter [Talaromyces proteolyticus]KAH8692270.1 monocarboxylate transporter [Talaromyces proteolyticus]